MEQRSFVEWVKNAYGPAAALSCAPAIFDRGSSPEARTAILLQVLSAEARDARHREDRPICDVQTR